MLVWVLFSLMRMVTPGKSSLSLEMTVPEIIFCWAWAKLGNKSAISENIANNLSLFLMLNVLENDDNLWLTS